MSSSREELQEALCLYTTDTLTHINTLKEFCDQMPQWVQDQKKELKKMKDIDTRANAKITKDFMKYTMSKECHWCLCRDLCQELCQELCQDLCQDLAKELKEELDTVLEDTRGGLEKLRPFLDAVKRLSVTSLSVFKEDNQVLKLPEGINLRNIWVVVMTTRMLCPLLVEFRRDDSEFFLPRLQNVVVLTYQLDKYIWTTKKICEMLQRSAVLQVSSLQPVVDLQGLSDGDIERMLSLIDECRDIRNNHPFWMVSLFQEDACSSFIKEFSDRKPRMMRFLTELEESAVQLERRIFYAKVSSVVCSLVGAVGGVLSIVGLAMASWVLILTGDILGVISRVSSAFTALAEFRSNCRCKVKADEVFKSFMEDVESLPDCLKTTMDRASELDGKLVVHKVNRSVSAIGKLIDSLVDLTSAITGPTKSIRDKVSLGLLNALFVIMDIVLICTDSISLSKGRETDMSKFIRARAALWRSEVDAWEKMSNSLREGKLNFKENQDILETDFYL